MEAGKRMRMGNGKSAFPAKFGSQSSEAVVAKVDVEVQGKEWGSQAC